MKATYGSIFESGVVEKTPYQLTPYALNTGAGKLDIFAYVAHPDHPHYNPRFLDFLEPLVGSNVCITATLDEGVTLCIENPQDVKPFTSANPTTATRPAPPRR